jgi:hypothetical protein
MDMGGMPTVSYGGMTGYTSYPAYIQNLQALQQARPDQYGELAGMTKYDPITGMVNPEFQSNMPIFDMPVESNMPSYGRGDRTRPVMATPQAGSSGPMRPRMRPEGDPSTWNSGGSGLLSGIRSGVQGIRSGVRDARDTVLDAMGIV